MMDTMAINFTMPLFSIETIEIASRDPSYPVFVYVLRRK